MDLESIKPDMTLDATGLSCPMPLLKTKKAMSAIGSGQILEVTGTDYDSKNDLKAWCERSGHEFLGVKEGKDYFIFYIRKG